MRYTLHGSRAARSGENQLKGLMVLVAILPPARRPFEPREGLGESQKFEKVSTQIGGDIFKKSSLWPQMLRLPHGVIEF